MYNKAFSKIWVIIIILILVGGGILAWQYWSVPKEKGEAPEELVKDETANWNTYKNEMHKFEVKYPENWMTREYSPGRQAHLPEEERTVIISFASNQESLIGENGVNIFVSPPNFMSWELYIEAENVICKEEIPIQNIKNLIKEGEIKQSCLTGESLYFSSLSGRIFHFYAGTEGKQIFNQILSIFRFIEDATADWKTYRNEVYGYEIKYPGDWFITISSDNKVVYFESPDAYNLIQEGKKVRGSYASNLGIRRLTKNEILRNIYKSILDYLDKDPTMNRLGEITVNGNQAYEVSIGGYGVNYGVWILKDNYVYELSFSLTEQKSLNAIEDQMLSTFKFLE